MKDVCALKGDRINVLSIYLNHSSVGILTNSLIALLCLLITPESHCWQIDSFPFLSAVQCRYV